MESATPSRTTRLRRQVERLGRTLAARRSAHRVRRLVESTPRRRIAALSGVTRATLVGRVVDVSGGGPAVETWRGGDDGAIDGRTTRPFVLDDDTGRITVRVPPDGGIVVSESKHGRDRAVVERGDSVAVAGRVVSEREWGGSANEVDGQGESRALTGPAFALLTPP